MRPLQELDLDTLSRCVAVFTDIDDTLTTEGQLPAAAYAALERLCLLYTSPSPRDRG